MDEEPGLRGAETPEQQECFKKIIDERIRNAPFYRLMGLSVVGLAPGKAHLKMKGDFRLCNNSGVVNGGAIASLTDAASGVAVETQVPVTKNLSAMLKTPFMK